MVLGQERGPNGELHLVSLRDNPRAVPCDAKGGVIVLRPVASLFFGNAECLEDEVCLSVKSRRFGPTSTIHTSGRSTSSVPSFTAPPTQIQRVINAIVKARGATPSTGGGPEHIDRSGGKPTEAAAAAVTGDCCSSSNWPFEARKRQLAPMIGAANVGPETRFILVGLVAFVFGIWRSLDSKVEACVIHQTKRSVTLF